MTLTLERVREVISYDPKTGVLRWLVKTSNRHKVGAIAGSHSNGRLAVCIDYHQVLAHRVAWLHHYGAWPTHGLDHINGNPTDNRIANLRDVPQRTNVENQRGPRSDNTSGYLGVTRNITRNGSGRKWKAKIAVDGKTITLLYSNDPSECHLAYLKAKRELHNGCTI